MLNKLWKKCTSPEFLIYLLFGVLTTAVNYVVFGIFLHILGDGSALLANAIAFVAAVTFAFLTNKPFVFKSKSWAWQVVSKELATFLGARITTFLLEEAGLFLCQDILHMDKIAVLGINGLLIAKLMLAVVVVLVNYILSKFIVFRGKKDNPS